MKAIFVVAVVTIADAQAASHPRINHAGRPSQLGLDAELGPVTSMKHAIIMSGLLGGQLGKSWL